MKRFEIARFSAAMIFGAIAMSAPAVADELLKIKSVNVDPVSVYDDEAQSNKIGSLSKDDLVGKPVQEIANNWMLRIDLNGRPGWLHPMMVTTNLNPQDIGPCNSSLGGDDPGAQRGIGKNCPEMNKQ